MPEEVRVLGPCYDQYERMRGPLMNEIIDPAIEKLGHARVNLMMSRVAARLSEFTGVEIEWHNMKDCSSWMHGDHGNSWFKMRKLK